MKAIVLFQPHNLLNIIILILFYYFGGLFISFKQLIAICFEYIYSITNLDNLLSSSLSPPGSVAYASPDMIPYTNAGATILYLPLTGLRIIGKLNPEINTTTSCFLIAAEPLPMYPFLVMKNVFFQRT